MAKTYKFSVTIQNKRNDITPQKGVDIEDLGALIQDLKKAIVSDDKSYCSMYRISNHGYTPNFITNSKKQYENFIAVHQNIYEKPFEDLRNREVNYAKTLKNILHGGRYLESHIGNQQKPVTKIYAREINKPVDTYGVITSVVGTISEMGARDFKRRTHVFLDGFDYKIYTTEDQDKFLRDYYRKTSLNIKIKQKKSIKSDRVISAILISATPKSKGTIIENIKTLSKDDLSFLSSVNTHEDILKLIRV